MPVFRSLVRCVSATKIYEAVAKTKIVIYSILFAQFLELHLKITRIIQRDRDFTPIDLYIFRVLLTFIRDFRRAPAIV